MITYLLPCPTFDTPFTTRLIWHDEADNIFYTTIPPPFFLPLLSPSTGYPSGRLESSQHSSNAAECWVTRDFCSCTRAGMSLAWLTLWLMGWGWARSLLSGCLVSVDGKIWSLA